MQNTASSKAKHVEHFQCKNGSFTIDWSNRSQSGSFDPYSDDPRLGVQKIALCPLSGTLVVAGTAGQVNVKTIWSPFRLKSKMSKASHKFYKQIFCCSGGDLENVQFLHGNVVESGTSEHRFGSRIVRLERPRGVVAVARTRLFATRISTALPASTQPPSLGHGTRLTRPSKAIRRTHHNVII